MTEQTAIRNLVVRLRREGSAVVLSVPVAIRAELQLKPRDLMLITARDGCIVARKIDVSRVGSRMDEASLEGGE